MTSVAEYIRGRPLPNLRAWRVSKYLAQNELAEMAGVARATITRAERGETVNFVNIRKIADALGITPDELTHVLPPEPVSGVFPAMTSPVSAVPGEDGESAR